MQTTVLVGMVIIAGFIFGKLINRLALPKVTGYIIAGLMLNPSVFDLVLAFITFVKGGTLSQAIDILTWPDP